MNTVNKPQGYQLMPMYTCHKKVWAVKIAAIDLDPDGNGGFIHPAEEGYAPICIDGEYVRRHRPQASWYYVVYQDGYKSWSPAKAFEEGYSRITGFLSVSG